MTESFKLPLQSPIGVAILTFVGMLSANVVRDRLSMASENTASAVKVEALSARFSVLEQQTITRQEFIGLKDRLDEIRTDLRDLRQDLAKRR